MSRNIRNFNPSRFKRGYRRTAHDIDNMRIWINDGRTGRNIDKTELEELQEKYHDLKQKCFKVIEQTKENVERIYNQEEANFEKTMATILIERTDEIRGNLVKAWFENEGEDARKRCEEYEKLMKKSTDMAMQKRRHEKMKETDKIIEGMLKDAEKKAEKIQKTAHATLQMSMKKAEDIEGRLQTREVLLKERERRLIAEKTYIAELFAPLPEIYRGECCVCMDNPKSVVFQCGHFVCCDECASKVPTCPFCRDQIDLKFKLFTN